MKNITRLLTGYKRSLSNTINRTPNFFAPAYRTGRPLRLCALIFLCAFAPLRDLKAQKAIHELPAKTTIDTNYLFIQGNPTTGKLYKTRGAALNAFISGGGGTATDTTSLSNRIDLKLNISDTTGLSNRIDDIGPHIDTTSLSNRIDAISSGSTDTTSLSNRIDAIPTISSFSKNAGRDSTILLLSSGTRYAVKDSIGATIQSGDIVTRDIRPSNYNTDYSSEGSGYAKGFIEGVQSFAGVNTPDTRPNVVYSFGYNVDLGGARVNTNEAAFRFGYETNYNINSDTARRSFEFHMPEVTTKEGDVFRPFSFYINKSGGYTQLNSEVESISFIKQFSGGYPWLQMSNSDINSEINLYANDSATVSLITMTNPSGGRVSLSYFPNGENTYAVYLAADSPTGKSFTTNMRTLFNDAVLSTSFMNISNTASTGTPSQPTLRLNHTNSGSTKVQDWFYNDALVAEVDKDYAFMAYKPVLFYYGGLMYRDLTLDYTYGGNFKIIALGTFADDTAAGVGGLTTGQVYQTSAGVLMIKQ